MKGARGVTTTESDDDRFAFERLSRFSDRHCRRDGPGGAISIWRQGGFGHAEGLRFVVENRCLPARAHTCVVPYRPSRAREKTPDVRDTRPNNTTIDVRTRESRCTFSREESFLFCFGFVFQSFPITLERFFENISELFFGL